MAISAADGTRPDLAEMAELADSLVEEIAAARSHCDELRAALDETDIDVVDEQPVDEPRTPIALLESSAEQPEYDDPDSRWDTSSRERARLGALSLALTGGSRQEARDHLFGAFGIVDCEDILDETFGSLPDPDPEPAAAPKRRFARIRRSR